MAYVKIIYQNSPSTATPINAQNLNHMDDGIAENDRRLNELETAGVVNKFNGRSGNVNPTKGDYDIADIGATDGQEGYVPVWRNSGTEEDPNWGFEMEQQGGSGHKILDADGSEMAQEDSLQFADSFVSDDDVNGKTVVENIKEHDTKADYDQATEDGFHVCDDGEDAVIGSVSDDYVEVTADGVKTYAQLLAELANNADLTKITDYAFINLDNYLHKLSAKGTSFYFANEISTSNSTYIDTLSCGVINTYYSSANGTVRDKSSDVPNNGTVITLHYGNKKAVVDLQTTANRCLMSDGVTSVEDKFEKNQLTVIPGSNISIITSGSGFLTEVNKIGNVVSGMIRFKTTAQVTSGIIAQIDGISILNPYITIIEKYSDDTILSKPAFIQNNPNQNNSIIIYSYPELLADIQYRISFTFLVD